MSEWLVILLLVSLMICEECTKEGKVSTVTSYSGSTTLIASNPYWDEAGNYHLHDPNTTTYYFRCSNGHEWTEAFGNKCWCGWPDSESKADKKEVSAGE